ncbi:MAG: methanogenesis marker 3 protein [Methanobacterium sp.]|uniref:methyl-coenzyme M reductase-associated protein Mmp3 n=1 Tax=Methanobacterium sp. TaxID=2164 RepID=UPI003D659856|nr:methanogenesis marker 3 protein [Methanobacterium sp.]
MIVRVNGEKINLSEGSTIKDAIEAANAPYIEGCVLGVVKGKEEIEKYVNKYKIKTSKGSIIIELLEKDPSNLIQTWKKLYKEFENHRVRWTTSNEVSMGPVKTNLIPTKTEHKYEKWDVIISLSGFTSDATHIIFSKSRHKSVYGVPEGTNGIFAQVVGGKRTLVNLTDDDAITEIKPVVERKSTIKSATITNLDTPVSDGNEIFTHILVKTESKSPNSVEHFFALSEDGKIKVDYESNSFVGFYKLQGLEKNAEYIDQRKRGAVTLRNSGKGMGRVYIYREDRVSTPSHTLIGHVDKGMQLLDIANSGDYVTVKSDPERIITISMTQKDAEEYLSSKGIEHIRDGLKDDDAIIVSQNPQFSMDIIGNKKVKTFGINKNEIIYVDINDNAPRSSWYFQKLTGIIDSPIGSLKVHFAFPGMKVMMFEGNSKDAKGLTPENTPPKCVTAGQIGITNMSRRHVGMIGVRFEDNDEFGPTGEPFGGTNIVGRVVKGLENLEKLKEGDIVYVAKN